jgi:hypothetical protein
MPESPRKATIKLFLLDGTPTGPRTIEKLGWTGHGIVSSRASYPEIRHRKEFDRTGVYLLLTNVGEVAQRIYVGEADIARERLDDHFKNREEWTQFILFTSKDGHLNKAHAKNLEARLWQLGVAAKRATVENSNAPQAPQLHESDESEVENFLGDMLSIYPLLGVTAFQAPKVLSSSVGPRVILHLEVSAAVARGEDLPEGFLVFDGATALGSVATSAVGRVTPIREKLLAEHVLVPLPGGGFKLTQDYLFNSSSQAAMVLLGYHISGPKTWKDESGRSLRDLEAAAIPEE